MPARFLTLNLYKRARKRIISLWGNAIPYYNTAFGYNRKVSGKIRQNVCHFQILIKNLLIKKLKIIDNSANLKNILPELSAKILATAFTPFRAIVFLD